MTLGTGVLTANPNPAPDGAYRLAWTPVRGATRYRLRANGRPSHEGPATWREYAGMAPGSYTYVVTACVLAFDIEACSLRPVAAPLTVVVPEGDRHAP